MDYYIGSIIPTAFDYAPPGWALCNGQSLEIRNYPALYAVIGNKFGGDGKITFKLPNLQGYCLVGQGTVANADTFTIGWNTFGTFNPVAPPHTHSATVSPGNLSGSASLQASGSNANSSTPDPDLIPAAIMAVDTSGSGVAPDVYSFGTNANAASIQDISIQGTITKMPLIGLANTTQVGNNMQPFVTISFQIAIEGIYPVRPS